MTPDSVEEKLPDFWLLIPMLKWQSGQVVLRCPEPQTAAILATATSSPPTVYSPSLFNCVGASCIHCERFLNFVEASVTPCYPCYPCFDLHALLADTDFQETLWISQFFGQIRPLHIISGCWKVHRFSVSVDKIKCSVFSPASPALPTPTLTFSQTASPFIFSTFSPTVYRLKSVWTCCTENASKYSSTIRMNLCQVFLNGLNLCHLLWKFQTYSRIFSY